MQKRKRGHPRKGQEAPSPLTYTRTGEFLYRQDVRVAHFDDWREAQLIVDFIKSMTAELDVIRPKHVKSYHVERAKILKEMADAYGPR